MNTKELDKLIDDLIKENNDVTIREYLEIKAELLSILSSSWHTWNINESTTKK